MTTEARMGVETRVGAVPGLREERTAARRLYGLVEIGPSGTVLYASFEGDGSPALGGAPDYTGLNFYAEVAPFRNVVDFKTQLDTFSSGSQPAHSLDFVCDCEEGPVCVRVLLARICERSQSEVTKSVLVHIRRVP